MCKLIEMCKKLRDKIQLFALENARRRWGFEGKPEAKAEEVQEKPKKKKRTPKKKTTTEESK